MGSGQKSNMGLPSLNQLGGKPKAMMDDLDDLEDFLDGGNKELKSI
jgi:hypothetical protein